MVVRADQQESTAEGEVTRRNVMKRQGVCRPGFSRFSQAAAPCLVMPIPALGLWLSDKNRAPGERLRCWHPRSVVLAAWFHDTAWLNGERNRPMVLPLPVQHPFLSPVQEDDHDGHQDISPILPIRAMPNWLSRAPQ